jgi:hypothetical protein
MVHRRGDPIHARNVGATYEAIQTHGRTRSAIHFAWWEVEDGDELLDNIPDLKHIRRVKQPISFNVNAETGERV